MNCFLDNHTLKQKPDWFAQLEIIQNDLMRLSDLINQFSELSEKGLAGFDFENSLEEIHLCLNRFEDRCQVIQTRPYEDEIADGIDEESFETNFPENKNWMKVRKEAKRANKLAAQLTLSLGKIRSGLGEYQNQSEIPEDLAQINRTVGNVINGLASDWVNNQD
jgi:hypothetical protein